MNSIPGALNYSATEQSHHPIFVPTALTPSARPTLGPLIDKVNKLKETKTPTNLPLIPEGSPAITPEAVQVPLTATGSSFVALMSDSIVPTTTTTLLNEDIAVSKNESQSGISQTKG